MRLKRALCLTVSTLAACFFEFLVPKVNASEIQIEKIGAVKFPWGLATIGPRKVLVTTKPGKLYLFDLSNKTKILINGAPESAYYRQGGLLDITVQQKSGQNYIFICYSKVSSDGKLTVAISKSILSGTALVETKNLFISNHESESGVHFGCRLALDYKYLYASLGDRGNRTNAQNPKNHAGSIIRLPLSGVKTPGKPGWLSEVYSIGHRNPQGLSFQKSTGQLWSHEHGPRGGDEINIIKKHYNCGWPKVSYGKEYIGGNIGLNYSPVGFKDPVWTWTPSIAPSGMAFYYGTMFSEFKDKLLVGALKYRCLKVITLSSNNIPIDEECLFKKTFGRIRDVEILQDGSILVLNDEKNGHLFRLHKAE